MRTAHLVFVMHFIIVIHQIEIGPKQTHRDALARTKQSAFNVLPVSWIAVCASSLRALLPRPQAHIMNGWRICLRQCVWMVKMNQSNTGMTRLRRRPFTKCIVIWIIINRNDAFDIRIYANNNTIWKRVSPLSMSLSIFLPHTLTSSESDQRGTEIIVSWTDAMRTTSTLCESNPLPIINFAWILLL